jgi:hypothetical protein
VPGSARFAATALGFSLGGGGHKRRLSLVEGVRISTEARPMTSQSMIEPVSVSAIDSRQESVGRG